MKSDDDRLAMENIVKFLFVETARQAGLQIILIEQAFIDSDPKYVVAAKGRWTRSSGEKLFHLSGHAPEAIIAWTSGLRRYGSRPRKR